MVTDHADREQTLPPDRLVVMVVPLEEAATPASLVLAGVIREHTRDRRHALPVWPVAVRASDADSPLLVHAPVAPLVEGCPQRDASRAAPLQ